MPVDRPRAWLTPDAYERAQSADAERRERRIRKLSELLVNVTVGQAPQDDGVAHPGMLVRVRYEIDGLTDHFKMPTTRSLSTATTGPVPRSHRWVRRRTGPAWENGAAFGCRPAR